MYRAGVEAFLAIARTLNVSKAAEQLNLAQSTVSKRLKVLEAEVGTTLFDRGQGSKSLRLTPAGEKFVDIAARLTSLWNEAQRLKGQNRHLSLAMGTLDSLNYALFPPLYRALSRHEPKISLKVITSHSPHMYDLVERREVDVGFTLLERNHPLIHVEKFYSEPMVVLRLASSAPSPSGPVHPRDLDPEYELFQIAGLGYQLWHDQWWDPLRTNYIHLDTAQLVLSFLCDERQWAIVPLSVAKMAQTRGNFSVSPLADGPPDRVVYKITHKHPRPDAAQGLKILDHYLRLCLPEKPGP